ncbi:MAG: Lrp/AsnC family transcriptional regulator [Candidatus Omnitrophota bacterium]|nr:Lrp/AsnC family transcriptional regulator [Candidatus Omnitrophota bacterium]
MLTRLDRKIIRVISQELPLEERPFKLLAAKIGIGEKMLLERVRFYKKNDILRKYAVALNHLKVGFRYNAMAAWNMPAKYVQEAGAIMASFPQVSHCYERKRGKDWNYNLYAMIHTRSKRGCLEAARAIAKKTDCKDYQLLFSTYEYKKSAAQL